MFRKFLLAYRQLQFYRKALDSKGHGTHSPFVYTFITEVLNDDRFFYAYEDIGVLKKQLLKDKTRVNYKGKETSVGELAKQSLLDKYNQLLFRIVSYYEPKNIVEIGTSLGLSTAYLASPDASIKVFSTEENVELASIAKQNIEELSLANIQIKPSAGNWFSHTQKQEKQYGLIFINQTDEDLFQVFLKLSALINENTIVVFREINQDLETSKSWDLIKSSLSTTISIELFQLGLVFFRKEQLKKQHFAIRF